MLEARLPGVRFENRLQPVASELPRMDIAAFVGFASTGPLHLPVAIDAPARFREIFGPDPELAWDAAAGRLRYGSLGGSVESFFANGGRRCWIVRVADAATLTQHAFVLPGLVVAGGADGTTVTARARAPGSWCETLAVGTRLARELVALREFPLDRDEATDGGHDDPVGLAAGDYHVDLLADPAAIQQGELLELFFGEDLPRLWLFVAEVKPQRGFLRCSHRAGVDGGAADGGHFWVASAHSPPDEAGRLAPMSEAEALGALTAAGVLASLASWRSTPLNSVLSVRRLRLELAVWENTRLLARLGDLGLARRHPRYWASLPSDAALLGHPSLSRRGREAQTLDREVNSPRFPLAGPHDRLEEAAAFYLPLAVADALDPALALGLAPTALVGTPLERDGLASFSQSLFVDPRLGGLRYRSLLTEAEHRYYVHQQELIGLHSLLPVEEISLLAVPDAHHGGWTRALPPARAGLAAPELFAIPGPDDEGGYSIAWSPVADATGYRLERDTNPDFSTAVLIHNGALTGTTLYLEPLCPRHYYLRVRASRHGELGPWSNTRRALLPRPQFMPCEGEPPAEFLLALLTGASPPGQRLVWQALEGGVPGAQRYELQESSNADFVGATAYLLDATETPLPAPPAGAAESEARRYFRVRGLAGERRGPFSNTVSVEPERRVAWVLLPEADYDDAALLAVQVALLRFAAARADMLALLSLPAHYRAPEVGRHLGKLGAGGGEQLTGSGDGSRIPPLSFDERPVLGYGALMHPWLTVRVADRGEAREAITVSLPPDGAVAGSMAGLAIQRGAWLAPANRVLQRVLALHPAVDAADWRQSWLERVNPVLQSPRGFLLSAEATLGTDPAPRAIHVRRLLILLRRLALREADRFVFAPHDPNLQHLVRHRFERVLADLYSRGAFAGAEPAAAFRVVTDESVNPPPSIERGRFIVELRVAPARALAFVTVRLVADERGRLAVEES